MIQQMQICMALRSENITIITTPLPFCRLQWALNFALFIQLVISISKSECLESTQKTSNSECFKNALDLCLGSSGKETSIDCIACSLYVYTGRLKTTVQYIIHPSLSDFNSENLTNDL